VPPTAALIPQIKSAVNESGQRTPNPDPASDARKRVLVTRPKALVRAAGRTSLMVRVDMAGRMRSQGTRVYREGQSLLEPRTRLSPKAGKANHRRVERVILMPEITDELLERGKSRSGGWSRFQLGLLGVGWPPAPGWRQRIIGLYIPDAVAAAFVGSKAARLPKVKSAERRRRTAEAEQQQIVALWKTPDAQPGRRKGGEV
jgi:hypothetical protein